MARQEFTQEDVNVRFNVQLGFMLNIGLYNGPITNKVLAEHIAEMIEVNGIENYIEQVQLVTVELDDGEILAANSAT